jgi:hypothetical protein
MFLKKLELVLSKVKLHKKINEIIFHTVFGVYESDNLLNRQTRSPLILRILKINAFIY